MLRAVLACGHTCQDTIAKKDVVLPVWKFAHAQCLHCAVHCHYSIFFSIYARLLILLQLVFGQHNMELKKALKNFDIKETKQNALTGFFFLSFLFCFVFWVFCLFVKLMWPGLYLHMHMLRTVLLGWPRITSSAWILLWIYLQTSNAFKPILLLYVLQPTVVDKRQIQEETRGGGRHRLCMAVVWFLWECCLSTIDSRAALCYWLPNITQSQVNASLAKLLECRQCLLHCYVVAVVVIVVTVVIWLDFLERDIRKWDIHKTDTHPHSPFYHYI